MNLQFTPQAFSNLSFSVFCNNVLDKHYAANLSNVRSNWTFPNPSPVGTAYAQVLPRDYDRFSHSGCFRQQVKKGMRTPLVRMLFGSNRRRRVYS